MIKTLTYRDKRLFGLAVAMLVVLGASSLLTIGRQEDPTITNLFATIITPYPGANPARVEALVSKKIEEELEEIAEIEEIKSTSRTGISVVSVELSQFIGDQEIEQAWSEIRDALSDAAVNFPAGVPEPTFDNDRTGAYTAISAIAPAPGREVPMGVLNRYAELLQDRLRQVPNTKFVHLFGEPVEEVSVIVDPETLAGLGITARQVAAAIQNADAKVQAGQVRASLSDTVIEVSGEIESIDRVKAVPVVTLENGKLVRVGDIATVKLGDRDPPGALAYSNGARAILVAARMEDDKQVDTWTASVKARMAAFETELPQGVTHELLFDQEGYTVDRLADVGVNLAIGVALVVAILFVTLGWRAALIVAAILPLTSLGSIAVLKWIGIPIHQMSVTGLIVALGLLVDAAIVMTDEIRKSLRDGRSREASVAAGIERLAVPLLASTVTTALAFTPMAMLPGPAGDFVGSIAMSVIVMLFMSLALAMTITPALSGWVLTADHAVREERLDPIIVRLFRATLRLSVAHPWLSILAALVLPVIGFGAFPTLTAQFFPGVDRDQFYVEVFLAPGSAISRSDRLAADMERRIRSEEGVEAVHWVIGESAPAFYYNMLMNQDGVSRYGQALISTASPEATEAIIPRLQQSLDEQFPEAQILVRGLVQGPPVDAPVELRVVGPEIAVLREVGEQIRARMAQTAGITHTRETLIAGEPKLVFDLNEDRVRAAGLDLRAVARQLEERLEGVTGGSLLEGTEELPVRLRLPDEARGSMERIRSLTLLAPSASEPGAFRAVPLTSLGEARLVPSEPPIIRIDGERTNTVQGFIRRGLLPEEVLAAFRADLAADPVTLPPGYRFETGGDSDARSETINNLISTLGVVIVLSVATIVLTFRSYRLSIIAGIVCVLSMGLSLFALAVFNYPFGINALIGVIGSIGVSINAAIIVMTGLQADPKACAGDREAVVHVVNDSSRHIVSTTLTTFGGFLPLILAGGGFWPPFAMSIAGGVLLSTIVSFYFTPPMFLLMYAKKPKRRDETPEEATDTPVYSLDEARVA
ncbi:MAG: efflux RND transporter permease subunit [Alphaproteobacteria bacterium]|nr:efflux RND transporter permease subunit [Alphaproteobacteria bacterium]